MYLIIGIWGGQNRIYAAFKFFLYTLLGSVLMLVETIAMIREAGTTEIPVLLNYDFPPEMQNWLWLAFFESMAVTMPRCRYTPGCPTRTFRRAEGSRVGKEGVSTCRSGGGAEKKKKKKR